MSAFSVFLPLPPARPALCARPHTLSTVPVCHLNPSTDRPAPVLAALAASLALLLPFRPCPAHAQSHHSVDPVDATSVLPVSPDLPTRARPAPTALAVVSHDSVVALPPHSSVSSPSPTTPVTPTPTSSVTVISPRPSTLSSPTSSTVSSVSSSSSSAQAHTATSIAPGSYSAQMSNASSKLTKLSEFAVAPAPAVTRRRLSMVSPALYARMRMLRARPAALGLMSVGALTSGSVLMRSLRSRDTDDISLASELHNACTVVCMQIPVCVSDRSNLLDALRQLVFTQQCSDAGAMAKACRAAADALRGQEGLLEDSRRFAPHVDIFVAESIAEAERRFCGHVRIEAGRLERLRDDDVGDVTTKNRSGSGDYGIVTMVVATTEGVDLKCYGQDMTNLQRLRAALDAIACIREGEAAGLELLWVPDEEDRPLNRSQVAKAFPCLNIA